MPTCGNCHQHHDTANEVRACYGLDSRVHSVSQTQGDRYTNRKIDEAGGIEHATAIVEGTASSFLRGSTSTATATTTRPQNLATEKQVDYLAALHVDRYPETTPDALEALKSAFAKLTRSEASAEIDALRALPRPPKADRTSSDITVTSAVPAGTYTVEMGDGTHVTLRLRPATWAKDMPEGSLVVEFLSGSDNTFDYTGFAFIVQGKIRVWNKFKRESRINAALQFLTTGDVDAAHERFLNMAEAYALESGNCLRCLRTLTVTESIKRGLGPVCAKAEGL